MKKMTLGDLQARSLELLKELDSFCRKNNITYMLAYGTLLGAIRHGGFIPWDDDVDVMMPREDYNRFIREYSSERYEVIDSSSDPTSALSFARLCDMNGSLAVTKIPWITGRQTGVWVDIFPLDSVTDDREMFTDTYRALMILEKYKLKARRIKAAGPLKKKLHPRISKLDPVGIRKSQDAIISLMSKEGGTHISQLACPENEQEFFSAELFQGTIDYRFEDMDAIIPAQYDAILTSMYGNYMELPPEKDRKPKQNYIEFFFR